ncbi:MAG: hypothetical protein HOQ28_19490 [Thermoleophilia bacterium]|nr:hypothetical protein [Thermoleophilia bacterium]
MSPRPRRLPRDALVDAAIDLPLDAVEEARDELVVVGRPELAAGRQRRLQLGFRGRIDPETVGDERPEGKTCDLI